MYVTDFELKKPNVICVHIGARAHYLLPIALVKLESLQLLITDTWIGKKWLRFLLNKLPITSIKSLAGRYDVTIPQNRVHAFSLQFLFFELKLRLKYKYSWQSTIMRDRYFEGLAIHEIQKDKLATHVLGLSYTALDSFKIARDKGLKTILFQVDPGLHEEELVTEITKRYKGDSNWEPAPLSYWERWKEECLLADSIFVNSQWSKDGLIEKGVSNNKISIIPLPYQIKKKHELFSRSYPIHFNRDRPLRCLFLGTLALRKGIHLVLEAAKELINFPIEFILVGRSEIDLNSFDSTNINYKGIVSREAVDIEYQAADLFLFPTISDGFGLTQLEAMAWQLPVIATPNCGTVVVDNVNGWIIQPNDKEEIIRILLLILKQPELLNKYSFNCLPTVRKFNNNQFASDLANIL